MRTGTKAEVRAVVGYLGEYVLVPPGRTVEKILRSPIPNLLGCGWLVDPYNLCQTPVYLGRNRIFNPDTPIGAGQILWLGYPEIISQTKGFAIIVLLHQGRITEVKHNHGDSMCDIWHRAALQNIIIPEEATPVLDGGVVEWDERVRPNQLLSFRSITQMYRPRGQRSFQF